MGWISSFFNSKTIPVLVVTLDALGTLYKFRRPVAVQYQEVATGFGLKANIDLKLLDQAFKNSLKYHNDVFPNYGKKKLESPEVWWTMVVNRAFGELVPGGEKAIPQGLGPALYNHFSSGAAYVPYPDVTPFLRSMATLKRQFTVPAGPLILTGIVTNSDPRVRVVLEDMGYGNIGPSRVPKLRDVSFRPPFNDLRTVFKDYYNIANDFDFLCTSYDTHAEKPSRRIWANATELTLPTTVSRGQQSLESFTSPQAALQKASAAVRYVPSLSSMLKIHIGDDYDKDYLGASNAGWEALLLARDGEGSTDRKADVKMVKSLDEAAMVVNLMAQELVAKYESA